MNFEEEFAAFLRENGLDGTGFIAVPVKARSPREAAALSERLAVLLQTAEADGDRKEGREEKGGLAIETGGPERQTHGERPVFIVEDRWRMQGEQVKARLLAHCRRFAQVYARNCEVRRIDKPTAAAFLARTHSYGDAACRYRYGLFIKRLTGEKNSADIGSAETLVAVGEFSSARTMKDGRRSYEWVRYASEPGVRVVGGMGKVLQKFVDDVHPDDVMTYADLEWSDGGAYRALGFEPEGLKAPVTFAIDTRTWTRTALKPGADTAPAPLADAAVAAEAIRYYRNFGSLKYRKTLPTCGKIPQDNGEVAPTCGKIPQDNGEVAPSCGKIPQDK